MTKQPVAAYLRAVKETMAADLSRPPTSVTLSQKEPTRAVGCIFQSITTDPRHPWRIVLGEYFLPAARFVHIQKTRDGGIRLVHEHNIVARAHCVNGLKRLFPAPIPGVDAKHLQCAVLLPNGSLLVSRNGERHGHIYRLVPRQGGSNWWNDAEKQVVLRGEYGALESLAFHHGYLYALRTESYDRPSSIVTVHRLPDGKQVDAIPCPAVTWLYGIGFRKDLVPYFVTDWRSNRPGVYHGEKLVLPDFTGIGIAFLPNGGAIVVDHRYSVVDFGRPSEIKYLPPHIFR